jgi:Ni,Fe-hydrogenase III small subunit
MLHILRQIARTGIRTEDPPAPAHDMVVATRLHEAIARTLGRALTIRHVDAGSCNGCELEIHALANPYYNIEGLGIKFVASPRHADLLLVTGPVSKHMAIALKRTYDATPDPEARRRRRRVRLLGRHLRRELREPRPRGNVIPVDVEIPGCPPTPTALLEGILAAISAAKPAAGDNGNRRARTLVVSRRCPPIVGCRHTHHAERIVAREQRRLAAIVSADVVGYSRLMGWTRTARWRD